MLACPRLCPSRSVIGSTSYKPGSSTAICPTFLNYGTSSDWVYTSERSLVEIIAEIIVDRLLSMKDRGALRSERVPHRLIRLVEP